jgi:hypothetical protein
MVLFKPNDNQHEKTKEMLFESIEKQPPPQIEFNQTFVDRIDSFKLLGVHISDTLSWDNHVNTVCLKAGKRLFFLKLLKRSSVSVADLLQYYKAVIRPVIEYACPVWQSGLTAEQKYRLEAIQRRAMRRPTITASDDYELKCVVHNVEQIALHLKSLSIGRFLIACVTLMTVFTAYCRLSDKLRHSNKFPLYLCRIEKFKNSFLPFALSNYQ